MGLKWDSSGTVAWDGRVGPQARVGLQVDSSATSSGIQVGRVERSSGTVEWDGRVGRSSGTVEWKTQVVGDGELPQTAGVL